MSLTQNFLVLVFSATQILLLWISRGSDNITMSNDKSTSKRLSVRLMSPLHYHITTTIPPCYLYYHFRRIIISQFHQHCVLTPVFLYANVSAVKAVIFDLFYLFWYNVIFLSSRINKGISSVLCQSLPHFSKWHRGRNIGKKYDKAWQYGKGSQKNTIFWVTNFLNVSITMFSYKVGILRQRDSLLFWLYISWLDGLILHPCYECSPCSTQRKLRDFFRSIRSVLKSVLLLFTPDSSVQSSAMWSAFLHEMLNFNHDKMGLVVPIFK